MSAATSPISGDPYPVIDRLAPEPVPKDMAARIEAHVVRSMPPAADETEEPTGDD